MGGGEKAQTESEVSVEVTRRVMEQVVRMAIVEGVLGGAVGEQRGDNKNFMMMWEMLEGQISRLDRRMREGDDERCGMLLDDLRSIMNVYFGGKRGTVERVVENIDSLRDARYVGKGAQQEAMGQLDGGENGWPEMETPWRARVNSAIQGLGTVFARGGINEIPADIKHEWGDALASFGRSIRDRETTDELASEVYQLVERFIARQMRFGGDGWVGSWEKRWNKVKSDLSEI